MVFRLGPGLLQHSGPFELRCLFLQQVIRVDLYERRGELTWVQLLRHLATSLGSAQVALACPDLKSGIRLQQPLQLFDIQNILYKHFGSDKRHQSELTL